MKDREIARFLDHRAFPALLLCAALVVSLPLLPETAVPFAPCALAVTEGEVEPAPDVELNLPVREKDPANYLPDASYFGHEGTDYVYPSWDASEAYVEPELYGDYFYDMAQNIALTDGEIARAKKLLAAYLAGEATGNGASVLEATQDVALGVYALDPAEYDGERAYVILPGTCLSDGQLLAVIDAYAQLGLTFDPEGLNYRNSMRGGGIDETRFLTEEEYARYHALSDMIERGVLDAMNVTPERIISLDERCFFGRRSFELTPYRPMTDGELVARLVAEGVERIVEDFDALQRTARGILVKKLGQPLSMELTGTSSGRSSWMEYDDPEGQHHDGGDVRYYSLSFQYTTKDGVLVRANCDFERETLAFMRASASDIDPMRDEKVESGKGVDESITQDVALATAVQYARDTLGLEGLTWYFDGDAGNGWGICYRMSAGLGDGEWITLHVGRDDGQVHGAELDARALLAL